MTVTEAIEQKCTLCKCFQCENNGGESDSQCYRCENCQYDMAGDGESVPPEMWNH